MNEVIFVRGLQLERIPGPMEYVEWNEVNLPGIARGELIDRNADPLDPQMAVKRHHCPVIRFNRMGEPPVYLAYSTEVERLLMQPLSTLYWENKINREAVQSAHRKLAKTQLDLGFWENASAWQLFKEAFRRVFR